MQYQLWIVSNRHDLVVKLYILIKKHNSKHDRLCTVAITQLLVKVPKTVSPYHITFFFFFCTYTLHHKTSSLLFAYSAATKHHPFPSAHHLPLGNLHLKMIPTAHSTHWIRLFLHLTFIPCSNHRHLHLFDPQISELCVHIQNPAKWRQEALCPGGFTVSIVLVRTQMSYYSYCEDEMIFSKVLVTHC